MSASSESSEDDDSLLIEQIARTHGMMVQQDCDKWLVPVNSVKFSPATKVPVGLELKEVEGEVDPELKRSNNYVSLKRGRLDDEDGSKISNSGQEKRSRRSSTRQRSKEDEERD
ncbi:uncharacterized protein LOC123411039 [Hordeum vulgare subsp. vulgare]|uniref:uncharacterized protein LOC123411039 n=1 Tax=Hordeum vulgare subsp. vulgare TaxID=112509 RepID=UPI001D1A4DB5|nr:uncharacterized protein LOC123411039 [Hordeum vulgare subsp. vulgare]